MEHTHWWSCQKQNKKNMIRCCSVSDASLTSAAEGFWWVWDSFWTAALVGLAFICRWAELREQQRQICARMWEEEEGDTKKEGKRATADTACWIIRRRITVRQKREPDHKYRSAGCFVWSWRCIPRMQKGLREGLHFWFWLCLRLPQGTHTVVDKTIKARGPFRSKTRVVFSQLHEFCGFSCF